MLGQQLGSLSGKITGQRVLESSDAPKVETTFEISGEISGVASTFLGTYWSVVRPDGTIYGECPQQGVFMTADGVGTYAGAGVGHFTGDGTASTLRGAIYLMSAPGKLAELMDVAILFEWEIDADGNANSNLWEWK